MTSGRPARRGGRAWAWRGRSWRRDTAAPCGLHTRRRNIGRGRALVRRSRAPGAGWRVFAGDDGKVAPSAGTGRRKFGDAAERTRHDGEGPPPATCWGKLPTTRMVCGSDSPTANRGWRAFARHDGVPSKRVTTGCARSASQLPAECPGLTPIGPAPAARRNAVALPRRIRGTGSTAGQLAAWTLTQSASGTSAAPQAALRCTMSASSAASSASRHGIVSFRSLCRTKRKRISANPSC